MSRLMIYCKFANLLFYKIEFNSGEFMGQKFFNVFTNLVDAQDFINTNAFQMIEVNSEVFSDGRVIVKYRSEEGQLN